MNDESTFMTQPARRDPVDPEMTTSIPMPICERLGDAALLFSWPRVDEQSAERVVRAAHRCLVACADDAVVGLVPGWSTLAVHYRPLEITAELLEQRLLLRLREPMDTALLAPRRVRIPVSFLPEDAVDLESVSAMCGLTVEACIAVLTGSALRVRLIGFSPGFPYLSGLSDMLHVPRRATPRLSVPAGSVAIAGGLAGIYPQNSPGGWQIVGRTSLRLFDPQQTPACLLQPGDEVWLERQS